MSHARLHLPSVLIVLFALMLGLAGCASPAEEPPAPRFRQDAWGIALWYPEGWVAGSEAFEVYHACAFGTSEEAVAWDASSVTHTAGGAVLQPLKAGARLRISVSPTKDSPDQSPEQYLQGLASQMGAFEKDVKMGELEPCTIGGEEGFVLTWEGMRPGALVPVKSSLAVIRHGDWDYRLQFDAVLEEWSEHSPDLEKILTSVQFTDSEG